MKRFALLPVFLIAVSHAISQPAGQAILPASLAFEMTDYGTKRTEGLNKLKELAKTQLEVVLKDQMSGGKLEAANAINNAIAALPITSPEKIASESRIAEVRRSGRSQCGRC